MYKRQGKQRSHRVGGSFLTLEMLVVVALYGTVCRFIFIGSVRGNKHRSHHRQTAKSCSHHIAHYVTVIILAGPDVSALTAHNSGHSVVDQGIEILYAGLLEFFLVFSVIDLLKNILETVVIFFRNGVFRGKRCV